MRRRYFWRFYLLYYTKQFLTFLHGLYRLSIDLNFISMAYIRGVYIDYLLCISKPITNKPSSELRLIQSGL